MNTTETRYNAAGDTVQNPAEWQNWLAASLASEAPAASAEVVEHPMVKQLLVAATAWSARADSFATGKEATCRDMALKLAKFGKFASDKQADFAAKLIEWSKPRAAETPAQAPAYKSVRQPVGNAVPKLFAVMQKHSKFYADPLTLTRRNQDSLCWVLWAGACTGKIEAGVLTVWSGKAAAAGTTVAAVEARVAEFDADPLGAAVKYGKLSGRCCSCGRDLTDPASIEAGIGPICQKRFL